MGLVPASTRLARRPWALLLLILAAGALLRFYTLSAESLYFDEAYSIWAARHSAAWLIRVSTERIFPPLYYLLLHFWLPLGQSEFAVRSLSVIAGLASIVAIYAMARRLFGTSVGLLSALLLAFSPLHLWFSQEVRMYMVLLTLCLCSAYFLLLALDDSQATVRPRQNRLWPWVAYVLTTALAMNTHYFTLFLALFQNAYVLYVLWRQRGGPAEVRQNSLWKRWVLSQLAIAMLSAIGLAGIFSGESGYWWGVLDAWHGAPTWRHLINTMLRFSLGPYLSGRLAYVLTLPLFGLCVAWSLLNFRQAPACTSAAPEQRTDAVRAGPGRAAQCGRPVLDDGLVFVLLYLVVPLGAIFLVSQFRSFWVLRYLSAFLPPYCILVARGIARMPGRILPAVVTGAIILVSLWPISYMYRDQQKEDWRTAVQYIAAREQPGDFLFMVDEDLWLPFEHYYQGSMNHAGISRSITDRDFLATRVGLAASSSGRIWLVLSHTDNALLRDYLLTSGYTELVAEQHLVGVEVYLFAVRQPPSARGGAGSSTRGDTVLAWGRARDPRARMGVAPSCTPPVSMERSVAEADKEGGS